MSDLQRAIDALVQRGKLRGSLTHNDIIDALSRFDVGPDHFDEILERFAIEGVEVVDDADDDELLAPVERSSVGVRSEGIEFDPSARELLKWATWIALGREAREVDSSHLVAAARADAPPSEPEAIWDIPFSAQMLSGLARACSGTPSITRNHILHALGFRFSLGDMLGEEIRRLLRDRGIDTPDLWRQLEDFEDCIPNAGFNNSEVGRRWQRLASEVSGRPLGRELGFLLFCVLAGTSASAVLKQSGVTEDLVVSLIQQLPDS